MRDEHRPITPHSAESEQLAALYALGTLEGPEQVAFRQHLAACLGCQQLVDRDLETLARLSAAAPEADAALGFREQLRARAARELERRAAPEP